MADRSQTYNLTLQVIELLKEQGYSIDRIGSNNFGDTEIDLNFEWVYYNNENETKIESDYRQSSIWISVEDIKRFSEFFTIVFKTRDWDGRRLQDKPLFKIEYRSGVGRGDFEVFSTHLPKQKLNFDILNKMGVSKSERIQIDKSEIAEVILPKIKSVLSEIKNMVNPPHQ